MIWKATDIFVSVGQDYFSSMHSNSEALLILSWRIGSLFVHGSVVTLFEVYTATVTKMHLLALRTRYMTHKSCTMRQDIIVGRGLWLWWSVSKFGFVFGAQMSFSKIK